MNPTIELIDHPISDLVSAEYNPRKMSSEQSQALRESITRFGFVDPVIVNMHPERMNILVGGHQRVRIAREMGFETVPAVHVSLTRDQERELNVRLNKNTGEFDFDLLAEYFSADELSDWGFTDEELRAFDTIEDIVEEDEHETLLPEVAVSQIGDLFQLGPHRLLCGDSRLEETFKALLGEYPCPNLMVTDPPYGVNYDPNWRSETGLSDITQTGKVSNDDIFDWTPVWKNFTGNVAYVWHAGVFSHEVARNLEEAGFKVVSQIIWNKPSGPISRGDYHWKHEPCWYVVRKGRKHHWQGARDQWTVWDFPNLNNRAVSESEGQTGHGTQKPIECMRRPILNNSRKGATVLDPFLGSGSTLIAAEQTGRICYGIELDPIYVDVIIHRWVKYRLGLGLDATVLRNGEYFDVSTLQIPVMQPSCN